MFHRITNTWGLMGESWQILKADRRLLFFPLLSSICCLLVLASFAVPIILTGSWQPPAQETGTDTQAQQIAYYGTLFAFYAVSYFVIVFFNAGLVACAVARMRGGAPTVGDGLRAAAARLPLIAGWALVSATVGLILRIIEDRSERIGALVAGLLGMAWTLVSFLVVPILVVERRSPFAALKESTAMLKRTWGEQVVGGFSFGLLFFLLALPAVLLVVLGIAAGSTTAVVLSIALAVIYLLVLGLVQSALQGIFQAAVYLYARDGNAPGFSRDLLSQAIRPK